MTVQLSAMRDPDKPQQIIEAAVRVFARRGYYNSRVSDIAREAGIAAGTIYLYFKTKDDILVTLFRGRDRTVIRETYASSSTNAPGNRSTGTATAADDRARAASGTGTNSGGTNDPNSRR